MMKSRWFRLIIVCCVLGTAGAAQANWFTAFWASVYRDYRRNNCWPEPFVCPDREAVRAPFTVMVAKGWRLQNTLGEQHFDPATGEINEAGKLKVRSILIAAPPQYRTVFVLKADNPQVTATRLDSVQESVVQLMPEGGLPPVLETNVAPEGWSAEYIYAINSKFRASIKDPRLPEDREEEQ